MTIIKLLRRLLMALLLPLGMIGPARREVFIISEIWFENFMDSWNFFNKIFKIYRFYYFNNLHLKINSN